MKLQSTYINPRNGKRYHQWAISEDPHTGRTTLVMRQLFGKADDLTRFESEVMNRWQKVQPTPEDLAFYLEHIAAR